MKAQPQHTIVLISDETVARFDFGSGHPAETKWSSVCERADDLSLGDVIALALREGPRCSHVWVLTNELWSGQVSLSPDLADAISGDQLEQTLALEAERESGISPFESRLAHLSLPPVQGHTRWWVTQAEHSQLREVEAAVVGSSAVLAGLASMDTTPNDLGGLFDDQAVTPNALEAFARDWLVQALSDPAKIPVIGSPRDVAGSPWQLRNALLMSACIFAVCLVLHVEGNGRLDDATLRLSQMTEQEKELRQQLDAADAKARQFNQVHQRNQAQIEKDRQRRSELRRKAASWLAKRNRPTQVLHALANTASPDLWIQEIILNEQSVRLSGIAMDNRAVAKLCQDLESNMDPRSWSVQPAKMSIQPATVLVRFEAVLIPIEALVDQTVAMLTTRGSHAL